MHTYLSKPMMYVEYYMLVWVELTSIWSSFSVSVREREACPSISRRNTFCCSSRTWHTSCALAGFFGDCSRREGCMPILTYSPSAMLKDTPYTGKVALEDDWWCCLKIFSPAYSLCILNDYTSTLQWDPTCGFMSDLCVCEDHLSGYSNPRSLTHLAHSVNNPITTIITILVYRSCPDSLIHNSLQKVSFP